MRPTGTDAAARATVSGLLIRPYVDEADIEDIVRIENAENEAYGIRERRAVGEMRAQYATPGEQFDPARDVALAEVDGRVVGFALTQWVDTTDGEYREHRLFGAIDPAWRRRRIGSALLADNERRARALAATHDTPRRRVFGAFCAENQPGTIALLQGTGYEPVRWFFDMERPTLDDVPDLPLPEGIEVREVTPDMLRRIWDADFEAFEDHWGGSDASDAAFQRMLDTPETDPSLWVIAWDGDEVAGGVVNTIYPEENTALGLHRGWLDSVFTRRHWRRRGLARALITRSLLLLRRRGMTSAALGVDADNPQGALGLYEGAGFTVSNRFTAWRKPFELEQ